MRDARRRLERLEARAHVRMLSQTAQRFGLTLEELLDEAREFFAKPLQEQLEAIDEIAPELAAEGVNHEELKAHLIREYHP